MEGLPSTTADAPILVVGAGAVGLSAAIDLARRGVGVRVIDRDPPRSRRESRALGLQPRTLEVFERLGVIGDVLAAGRPLHGFAYHVGPHRLVRLGVTDVDAPFPFILLLPQGHLEELLIERLAQLGVEVERGREAVAIDQADDHVQVKSVASEGDADGEDIRAQYVIAADGGRSTLRHLVGATFHGAASEGVIHLLDTDLSWSGLPPAENTGNFYAGTNTIVGLGRVRGPVWRVIAYLRSDDPRAADELSPEAMQSVLDEHPYLGATVRNVEWQSVYRVSNRMTDQLRHGRMFLAGDAAHIHSPMGGQGLNTGVQDAHNLTWKLAARLAGAPDALLDSYARERLPVISAVLRETSVAHRLLSGRGRDLARPIPAAVARLVAPLVGAGMAAAPVRRRIARAVGQIAVGYRESPLVFDEPTKRVVRYGAIRAGDRAPDVAMLKTAAGFDTRLHAVLAADTSHHLLVFGGLTATDSTLASLDTQLDAVRRRYPALTVHAISQRGPQYQSAPHHPDDLYDLTGSAHRRYDAMSDTCVLVRPDGYITARFADARRLPSQLLQETGAIHAPRRSAVV